MFRLSPLKKRRIKKKIRRIKRKMKRFWNEWGISRSEAFDLIALIAMFTSLFAIYIVLSPFYQ